MKTSVSFFLLGLFLVGCAKEKKYETVYKDPNQVFSKSLLSSDPSDPYVYIPSVENTPMNITASRPYWLGEQKLVVFKFSEKMLEVLELPSDPKHARNEANFSPVFKLEIDHKDYRCKDDQFGECSNSEEEVDDKPWGSKRFFKADFTKLATLETNSLPEQLTNLFQNCFSEVGSVVKDLKVDKDSLNIKVEKTIKAGIACADVESFEDLRNLTFKLNYHYSFVKLSKIASRGYEPVVYPNTDQNTFGFFTSTLKKLTADNQTTLDSDVTLMNRWDPKRKEITYNLSDSFYDADMKSILDATEKAVGTINKSFAQAGVDLKINLTDGRGKATGDIRNSFIILVKDPQASGVIGYGPSVTNPQTGEIIKAQTVMYYGTIRKFIQETYDELVAEAQIKASNAASSSAEVAADTVANGRFKHGTEKEMLEVRSVSQKMRAELLSLFQVKDEVSTSVAAPVVHTRGQGISTLKLEERLKKEIFSHDRIHKHHDIKDEVEEMSRHNMYHESMVNWHDSLSSAVEAGDLDLTDAKPWNELSNSEKEALIEKLMPYVWIPTLVHELGHNLGLRHNFNGSEDKDNYYSDVEREQLSISRKVTYSSVMDYSYSSLNQLPVMGKYDLAALRFGYNREVQKADGSIMTMPKATLEEMKKDGSLDTLKEFKYCTDEHVSVNAGCKRFDEGSSLTDIAKHLVKAYKKRYETRNQRNNKLNFSSFTDGAYYQSSQYFFHSMRVFFESFDRIKGMYPGLKPEQWESIEFLKDLKQAVQVVADLYIEVLKTPSVHCAVVSKATGQLAGIVPLEDITFEAISCFDQENMNLDTTKYAIVAETGKHFNHARSPYLRGDIKADPTQISVRGIWADKVLAMDYLMKREMKISTFDTYRTSFLDHPEFKDKVMEALLGFLSNKISHKEIEFKAADGQKIMLEHDFAVDDTHNITKSFSSGLNNYLGIKKASTDFREIAVPLLKRNLKTADDETTTQGLLQSLTAMRVDPTIWIDPSSVAATAKIKDESGRVVSQFAATETNIMAVKLMKDQAIRMKLEKTTRAELIKVYQLRKAGQVPTEIPAALKDAFEVEIDKLEAFLLGEMPTDKNLHKMLNFLSLI